MIKDDFKKCAARSAKKDQAAGAARKGAGITRQPQLHGPQLTGPRPPMPKGAFVMPATSFAAGMQAQPPATDTRAEKTESCAAKDAK